MEGEKENEVLEGRRRGEANRRKEEKWRGEGGREAREGRDKLY